MKKSFLFLLKTETYEQCEKAYQAIRTMDIRVSAQFGFMAFEVICTSQEAEKIYDLGYFCGYSGRSFTKDHREQFSQSQQNIVNTWNNRFTQEYKKLKYDQPSRNIPWGAQGFAEPAPYTMFNVTMCKEKIQKMSHNQKVQQANTQSPIFAGKTFTHEYKPQDMAFVESTFTRILKSSELGYHAARLWTYLTPAERTTVNGLDITDIPDVFAPPENPLTPEGPFNTRVMHGKIAVGLVIVESSLPGGPTFTPFQRGALLNQIFTGHNFLTQQHPSGNLTWVYDLHFVNIAVDDMPFNSLLDFSDNAYWILPGLAAVELNGMTFPGQFIDHAVDPYRKALYQVYRPRHTSIFFVTPYNTSDFATTSAAFTIMAPYKNNWGNHGFEAIHSITAHETCHHYQASDEYSDTRTNGTICTDCNTVHGANKIPNGNCEACACPGQGCLMLANQPYLCEYTKGHIGWSDIFVELFTADVNYAGTDDQVWLDIGDKRFVLDSERIDDRERGGRQGYAIWTGGNLPVEDIKRILIRKAEDGSNGGWKLNRVKVYHKGLIICNETPNVWLGDDHLWWVGCIKDTRIINSLQIKVTTANEQNAGTDDEVRLEIAGHIWKLDNTSADDFERGATNTFDLDPQTGFYPEQITNMTIRKSHDGNAGGWKLQGIELIVNGTTVYNDQSINIWLKGTNLSWTTNL